MGREGFGWGFLVSWLDHFFRGGVVLSKLGVVRVLTMRMLLHRFIFGRPLFWNCSEGQHKALPVALMASCHPLRLRRVNVFCASGLSNWDTTSN